MVQSELLCIETTCGYCGARLEVTAAAVEGEPKRHPYVCPQCGKAHRLTSTGHPHVRVLAPRTDGKTGKYQETMF
jgi:hypothetical protein